MDPAADIYVKAFSYRTSQKYSGGDSTPVHVLAPEKDAILSHLNSK
jgi:hypothetical protein